VARFEPSISESVIKCFSNRPTTFLTLFRKRATLKLFTTCLHFAHFTCFSHNSEKLELFGRYLLPGTNVIKLFTAVIYKCLESARVFIPVRTFQPNILFAGKAWNLPLSVSLESFSTWVGSGLTLKH
jgi:hypothetical protein